MYFPYHIIISCELSVGLTGADMQLLLSRACSTLATPMQTLNTTILSTETTISTGATCLEQSEVKVVNNKEPNLSEQTNQTFPEILQDNNYTTYNVGKWHCGFFQSPY